jgi:hypothetical protein
MSSTTLRTEPAGGESTTAGGGGAARTSRGSLSPAAGGVTERASASGWGLTSGVGAPDSASDCTICTPEELLYEDTDMD